MRSNSRPGTLVLTADWSDPPPCGTACALCVGHFCPAKGYLGEQPICRACGEGKRCGQAEAQVVTAKNEMPVPAPTHYERRCADCRGALGDQTSGAMCWPCQRRQHSADERAQERAVSGRERYVRAG
jgi:hypothetical protein